MSDSNLFPPDNSDISIKQSGINKPDPFLGAFSPPGTLETIETHISRVFLTDKFAFKQKKPVNFGFVDYTTLEKRIFLARRELSLNRRACRGVYLDLQELRQKKDKLFIGFNGGTLIDVFVRMRRVDSEKFLSNILKLKEKGGDADAGSGTIAAKINDILKKTAKKIYLFHKNARTSKRISGFGSYAVYKANWDDNFLAIEGLFKGKGVGIQFRPLSLEKKPPADEKKGTDSFYSESTISGYAGGSKGINKSVPFFSLMYRGYSAFLESPLFSEFIRLRSEGGFVRDVHGDLRMEHIAVFDTRRTGGICLMDCVEFDERYRCQDIYLDIAFLLMDFEYNGYFYESVLFFGYYKNCFNYEKSVAPFGKYEPSVIPFFKAYRAVVRTKIALLSPEKGAAPATAAKALKYFNLAAFYTALSKRRVVILNCGLSGSGKSSLSAMLSRYFYARVFSTDEIRQNLFGAEDKSVKYSAAANIKVYETMLEEGLKEFESGKGGSIIFDAVFLKRAHRGKIINSFNKKDCIFIFVYSKIYDEKEEIILKRLADRFGGGNKAEAGRPAGVPDEADYSEAGAGVYFNQKTYFEEPSESEIEAKAEVKAEQQAGNGDAAGITVLFAQADASLELKDRFNELMKDIVEKYGKCGRQY